MFFGFGSYLLINKSKFHSIGDLNSSKSKQTKNFHLDIIRIQNQKALSQVIHRDLEQMEPKVTLLTLSEGGKLVVILHITVHNFGTP